MSLSQKQASFAVNIAALINFTASRGYAVTFGDAYRDPRVHGEFGKKRGYAHKNSVHKIRLAVDLNLFADVDGDGIDDYLPTDHPAWVELGEFWESLHPDARWGGRFNDQNHFSYEHWGVR